MEEQEKGRSECLQMRVHRHFLLLTPVKAKKFYSFSFLILSWHATGENSPSRLDFAFSGHPCPEIAVSF